MKRVISLFVIWLLAFTLVSGVTTAFADGEQPSEEYVVDVPEGYNLATNKNNWAMPTLSTAMFSVDENTGMRFEEFVVNQQCTTMFNGGRFGEFKLSMYLNANLNVPAEGKAQWRYSEFHISFLVDVAGEDMVAEDSKPWYANKVYMTLDIGLTSGGTPICTFLKYNAFAKNCSMSGQAYVGDQKSADLNIVDGKKHWVELEVKNYEETTDGVTEKGKLCQAFIDGRLCSEARLVDDTYYDSDSKKEYDVKYSELNGSIGMYAMSDWPVGYSPSKMNNFMAIEKVKLVSYDNDANGELVGQCEAPVYKITAKDYITAAGYEVGDPIEIQLSDLFAYEGDQADVTYTATCNGENIGTITNGFWAWTPDKAGMYDIDFKGFVTEDNQAMSYITLRVTGGTTSTDPEPPKPEKKGCGGGVSADTALVLVLAAATGAVLLKRKGI